MSKILDYEQMLDFLAKLNPKIIKEEKPIGNSNFGEPIRHYSYGKGKYHVILTAGTHSSELITNIFLLRFMEKLSNKEISLDENIFTLHFFPILNPEGTIVVTSAIRTMISKESDDFFEQLACLNYYLNSRNDDYNVVKYKDISDKLIHLTFKNADFNCINEKYEKLRNSMEHLLKDLPKGVMVNWSSNGLGVDLNSNIEFGEYVEKYKISDTYYGGLRLNQINRFKLGPFGCPFRTKEYLIEPENKAILDFYNNLIKTNIVIGSFVFHSCGGEVHYLDYMKETNYWNKDFGTHDIIYNRKIAKKYADIANYKLYKPTTYTTFCSKLRSLLPGTLVAEIGEIRSNPLSQFIDIDFSAYDQNVTGELTKLSHHYSNTIDINTKAVVETINYMKEAYYEHSIDILVNKENVLPDDYRVNLIDNVSNYKSSVQIADVIYDNWLDFKKFAKEKGFELDIESGYRSISKQQKVFDEILNDKGSLYAQKYVAQPGFSEHHTGLAIDICLLSCGKYLFDQDLMNDQALISFIKENAYKYGFILRYPLEKEEITGYSYEPWHLRFVGINLSEYLFRNDLTLEEYYKLVESKSI